MTKTWTRVLLSAFIVMEAVIGFWATLAPRSFFDDGPIPGSGWASLLPPYNEHAMRDFGGLSLSMTVVLVVAAVKLTPLLVRTSMAAMLVFAVPHTIFHVVHLEHFSATAAVAQTTLLVLTVVVPIGLIAVAPRL
jgi:hypothetical protein